MLESIFKRRDVLEFIDEVISNVSYCDKKSSNGYEAFSGSTLALFTFFDALYKYKIIIEVDYYLDEYVTQIRKLIKKLDNFNDINEGINAVIGKMCALKLGLSNQNDNLTKEYIIKYIYDKYIVNGYIFHGFPSVYREGISRTGLVPEEYHNNYDKFIEINKIFARHGYSNILEKDFNAKSVYFTDSFVMGCFYAYAAPMYFYRLVGSNDLGIESFDKSAYLENNYFACFNNLNLVMKKARLSDNEKKLVIKYCFDEWKNIKRDITTVSILLVKRNKYSLDSLADYNEIISDSHSCKLSVSIGKIFNSYNSNIKIFDSISSNELKFININNYKVLRNIRREILEKEKNRQDQYNNGKIVNAYGSASILMLLGSLFITLGVIMTILMVSRGG